MPERRYGVDQHTVFSEVVVCDIIPLLVFCFPLSPCSHFAAHTLAAYRLISKETEKFGSLRLFDMQLIASAQTVSKADE